MIEKKNGRVFRRVDAPPASGEYQLVRGRILVFSPQDASKTLRITFRGSPYRVAVLPAVNTTNLPYLDDAVARNVEEHLRRYGFEVISGAEVREVCREQQFNPSLTLQAGNPLQPVDVVRLSHALNARYLILGVVSSDKTTFGFSAQVDPYTSIPVLIDDVYLGTALAVIDGTTGGIVHAAVQHRYASVNPYFGGHRSAREKMVRQSIEQIFKEYFE